MISPGDLRSPTGDLADSLFPGESASQLEARIQGYIDEGAAKDAVVSLTGTDLDDALKAWAYYRAYSAVYVRLLNNPSTVVVSEQGQTSSLWSQIEGFSKLADQWLAYYRQALPASVESTPQTLPPSGGVPNEFTF